MDKISQTVYVNRNGILCKTYFHTTPPINKNGCCNWDLNRPFLTDIGVEAAGCYPDITLLTLR